MWWLGLERFYVLVIIATYRSPAKTFQREYVLQSYIVNGAESNIPAIWCPSILNSVVMMTFSLFQTIGLISIYGSARFSVTSAPIGWDHDQSYVETGLHFVGHKSPLKVHRRRYRKQWSQLMINNPVCNYTSCSIGINLTQWSNLTILFKYMNPIISLLIPWSLCFRT